jgi:hypothetical protein
MVKRTNGNGDFPAQLHQATGMVSAQLNCDVVDAMNRLVLYSEETERSLEEVAADVINGVIRFDS